MSSASNRGQFVWHELMTTDTSAAGAFYPRIAGWTTQSWDQDDSYTLWLGKDGPLGGVMSLPQKDETPASHWLPYIGTDDVATTVAAATERGASIRKDTTELPNGGSYAVLQDPHGAVFAIHGAASAPQGAREPADFSWHELSTADLSSALDFYSGLFGWTAGPRHDMGELGFYQLIEHEGRQIGGMYMTPAGMSPNWLSYVRVDDVDQAAKSAKAAGGRIINGPMQVPGGDWIAQLLDPQGAAFAIHAVKSARPGAERKPVRADRAAKASKSPKTPKTPKTAKAAAAPMPEAAPARKPATAKRALAAKQAAKRPAGKSRTAKKQPARVSGPPRKSKVAAKRAGAAAARRSAKGKAKKRVAAKRSTAAAKPAKRAAPKRSSRASKRATARKSAPRRKAPSKARKVAQRGGRTRRR